MAVQSTPLDAIIDALELEMLEPDEQEEIMSDIGSLIFQGSLIRLMQTMDPKTKDEFGALVDSDAPEEDVADFIAKRVPGADRIITETIKDMTDDILAVTGYSPQTV